MPLTTPRMSQSGDSHPHRFDGGEEATIGVGKSRKRYVYCTQRNNDGSLCAVRKRIDVERPAPTCANSCCCKMLDFADRCTACRESFGLVHICTAVTDHTLEYEARVMFGAGEARKPISDEGRRKAGGLEV